MTMVAEQERQDELSERWSLAVLAAGWHRAGQAA
jgi:hypothetical protein